MLNSGSVAKQAAYIAGAETRVCKEGNGVLHGVLVGSPFAGAVCTIKDEGETLACLKWGPTLFPQPIEIDVPFFTNLSITTNGDLSLTVIYS